MIAIEQRGEDDMKCLIGDCVAEKGMRDYFCRAHWFALPLSLRQRWWRNTDYGRNVPSDELKRGIEQSSFMED